MSCNFCLEKYDFESFKWGIIPLDFMGFSFKISKSKNNISYIK